MKRTTWMVTTLFAVTAARASDLATTFHFDPSLSREVNPIVAQLGGDAKALLLSNMIGVAVFLFIPLFWFWRCRSKRLTVSPTSLRDFASLLFYDRILPKWQLWSASLLGWPLPKDWSQVVRLWGFAGCWTVVFGGFLATFSWWAVSEWHWAWYQALRSALAPGNYPVIELLACIPTFYVAAIVFVRTEYAEFRNRTADDVAQLSSKTNAA